MPRDLTEEAPGIRPGRWDAECREALAGEYALGTLHGPARRRFERLLAVDGDLRRRVRCWEGRLAPLVAAAEPQAPPDAVWVGIRARMGESGPRRRRSEAGQGGGWWNSLPLWRGLAVAATVLLALVAAWSWLPGSAPMAPKRMAVVTDPEQTPLWVLSSGSPEGVIRVRTLRSPNMGPDRVCPLWLQWGNGERVRRAAILPEKRGTYTFRVPRDMPLGQARLTVSVEPAADVPQAGPRGKVVYQGDWIRL